MSVAEPALADTTRTVDPWELEARRSSASTFRRPAIGPVPRLQVYLLGTLAALRAGGLVLIAEAVARGIAALTAGDLTQETTRWIVMLGIAGAIVRSGAEWGTAVLARRIASGVKRKIRGALWRRIAAGSTSGGADAGGTAVLAADGLDDLDDYYISSLPATIAAAVVPMLVGLRILGADWLSAAVIVLTVPLIPVFMVLIGRHTVQRTDAALTALTRMADHLAELARGLPVLVGLGRVDEQTAALEQLQRGYRERTQQTLRWAFLSALALELIATISVAIVAVFLGLRLLQGTMSLEPALLTLILAPEVFAALRQVGAAFHASQDGLAALERSQAMLREPLPESVVVAGGGDGLDSRPGEAGQLGEVRLDGLSVQYAGRETPTVSGLTAQLRGIVSIAGPSGAGKSTLLAALTGTLPDGATATGRIHGVHADAVGWAPQAPRAFADTPRAELALYGADPLAALEELGLAHVADAAPAELSPGELRRLAVARALARVDTGARLLVLDEPTAHLDAVSAALVRDAIMRRAEHAIVVFASHEPETQALATSIVEIADTAGRAAHAAGARESRSPDSAAPGSRLGAASDDTGSTSAATVEPQPRATGPRVETTRTRAISPAHRIRWIAAITMTTLSVGFSLALAAVSGWLIVRASIEEHIMVLMVAIVGVRAFGIFRSVGRYAERLFTHDVAFRTIDDLRLRLWQAISARGAGSRRLLEGGAPLDYLVTLTDDLREHLPRVVPPIAAGIAVIGGAIVTTAFVAPPLTLPVALVLTLATASAAALAVVAERGAADARVAARSEIVRGTAALHAAAADLRGNGVSSAALERLDGAADRLATAERRAAWAAGLGGAVSAASVTALAALVPALAPDLPGERAAVIALLCLALLEPIADLITAVHRVPAMRAVLARLSPMLAPAPQPTWGSAAPPRPVASLQLDAVTVRYPGTPQAAVADVTAIASTDRWLHLDGPSGSGKSTILSAIMGALPLEHGAIVAAGAQPERESDTGPGTPRSGLPLTALDASAWRSRVAWCPQDAYVFDSTLRGNLRLARTTADAPSDDAMRDALEQAGLGSLLGSLARGLDTRVGAGGSALSGGERQRLAVARALLTRADVVLLDEPTAHLDAPTASALMADLRAATAGRVVVLVSHRAADREATDARVQLR